MFSRNRSILLAGLVMVLVILAACVPPPPAPPAAPTGAPPTEASADKPAPVPPPTDELVLLRANSWQWTAFEDTAGRLEIKEPAKYRASFNTDASLAVAADCNNAAGSYQGEGGNLTIDIEPVTRAACTPESRSQQFIELLAAGVRYAFEGQNLRIEVAGENSSATMVLAPTDEAVVSPEKASEAVTPAALADTLGNLSYTGIFPNQPVTLTNGSARYDDGSSAQPFVRLLDHLIPVGDLNGDGAGDAVVLLEDNTSGTGRFVYAVAVMDALRNPTPTEAAMIGDRIQVKSLVIEDSEVVADLVAQGPGDAACCASWNVRKVFALADGGLTERSSEELSKISLPDLDGTKWRLVDLNTNQEQVLPDTEITMLLADGQVSGSAGCNNYNGTVSSKADDPSSFVVGPIGTTKKLCPEPVANQESSYLT
ncbi:MAG: META domain-containing protein, partial [Actinomycetes bacterium]